MIPRYRMSCLEKWSVIYDQKIIDAGVRIPDEPEPISEPND